MALIATPKVGSHTRSISYPSRSHPSTVNVEEHLNRLKASETTATLRQKLGDLRDVHESVDDMLQFPLVHQALSHKCHDKWVENVLDGSLRVLDVCGTTRDVLSQMKECVQDLESSLRRKRGETILANEVGNYMIGRKNLNKAVSECLRNLKRVEKKHSSVLLDKDCKLAAIVSILREVEEMSLSLFESLLSSISQPKARSKPSSWSLVSKLMLSKRIACEGEDGDISEVEKINDALNALNSQKLSRQASLEQLHTLLKQLETFESSIQDLEEGLESLFRHLVKTRVSLLNSLSH